MYFDTFDIIEAHLAYNSDYHSGQNSPEYRRACRILTYYTPSPLWYGFASLTKNGREIYSNLKRKARA